MSRLCLVVAAATALTFGSANAALTRVPGQWKNCTVVNKRYPHGVGRLGAHDKTRGQPVTTFTHITALYLRAISYNRGLDRDKDGIACEQL